MADIDKQKIEELQDELGALGSIASDVGKSLKEAFNAPGLEDFKKATLSTLSSFSKSEKVLGDIAVTLEKVKRNEISRKDLAKEINKLKDLEDKITNDIRKANAKIYQDGTAEKAQQQNLTRELEEQLAIIKEQRGEVEDISKAYKGQNTILDAAKKKLKDFNATYLSTLGILKFIIDAALKADKQTTELAKSLGVGKDQAKEIRQEFVKYSRAAGDSFVTTNKLIEAQNELSEQLGVSVKYSGKQTEDFSRLTKLMGLSVEQAGKLARLSIVNSKSIEATTKSIIRGSAASQRANKISVDQRTILKDVANLSEGILIKFQNNPEALGAAVVQARKLGLTLEQVDKVGESLLNWTSSIQNELEAELITGKQINLEKARYAALTGDQATLMTELSNQVGSLSDYQNMNVIAQKSLAQAFGMSRDEMSKMLLEQEKINKLGDVSQMTLNQQLEALKAQGEPLDSVLYKQIQQQSAQEKFNNAVEKLQDLIGNLVAGPLGQLIDGFASIASSATVMKLAIGAMLGMSITRLVTGLAALVIPLITGAAASVTMMSALTLGVGAVAILASIAGISSAMNSAKEDMSTPSKTKFAKGGIVTSEINNATVGEAGPEAIIPLNSSKASKMLGGGNTDLTPMIAAINELHNTVKTTSNRPSVAYINGKDAFAEDLGKSRSLGTSQNINTAYKVA